MSRWKKACNCKYDYTITEESLHHTPFNMTKECTFYNNMTEKVKFFFSHKTDIIYLKRINHNFSIMALKKDKSYSFGESILRGVTLCFLLRVLK